MVEVTIHKKGRTYTAKVCTECGRVATKDAIFKIKP